MVPLRSGTQPFPAHPPTTRVPDDQTQIFIVRFWREPRESAPDVERWRGVVEHLKSGDRRFVRRPDDIGPFVALYVNGDRDRGRIKRWWWRWTRPQP